MNDPHEELVHLSPREAKPKERKSRRELEEGRELAEEDLEMDHLGFDKPVPAPKKPVNRWALLKRIKDGGPNGLALSDIRYLYSLEDPQSPFLQEPLGLLLREGYIRSVTGTSRRSRLVGVLYLCTDKGLNYGNTADARDYSKRKSPSKSGDGDAAREGRDFGTQPFHPSEKSRDDSAPVAEEEMESKD